MIEILCNPFSLAPDDDKLQIPSGGLMLDIFDLDLLDLAVEIEVGTYVEIQRYQ